MDYLWKKFEKEYAIELTLMDRQSILSSAVRTFVDRDPRSLAGDMSAKNPEAFREKVLRQALEGHLKRRSKYEVDNNSSE